MESRCICCFALAHRRVYRIVAGETGRLDRIPRHVPHLGPGLVAHGLVVWHVDMRDARQQRPGVPLVVPAAESARLYGDRER